MKFVSEMWVLFQKINNLPEISIIVQSSVLSELKLDVHIEEKGDYRGTKSF